MSQNSQEKSKKVEPYYPIYARKPNILNHYEKINFVDSVGNKAILTIAHYTDKNGKKHEAVAQVSWL